MDGSRRSILVSRDTLLYHNGQAYRFLPLTYAIAGCFLLLKFGARNGARAFIASLAGNPAMRHRLHAEASHWAAYFGQGGVGYDTVAWLTEQVLTRRLGLYRVVCGAAPRGEPKKPEEKKSAVREIASTVADNLPIVGPIKSALQAIAGVDLVTDEPVNRWVEGLASSRALFPAVR